MEKEKKRKVDAYWQWRESEKTVWDLQAMRFTIDVVLPTCLLENLEQVPGKPICGDYASWHIGTELPVPSTLFEDISDDDLNTFSEWFGYDQEISAVQMVEIFKFLNSYFTEGVPQGVIRLLGNMNVGLLLMVIGEILKKEQWKAGRLCGKRKRHLLDLLERIDSEKNEVIQAIEIFKKCLDATNNQTNLDSDIFWNIGRRIKKHLPVQDFSVFLDEMKDEAINAANQAVLGYKGVSDILNQGMPNRNDELPDNAKRGLVALRKLFLKRGYKKRKSAALILDIFEMVGVQLAISTEDRKKKIQALNVKLERWSKATKY